ncbi:tail fiber domain-containing protein, partial [Candidatus Woesearchaeota archaeon]|nr:tail fiber domain-containing protein [Candidatus Woesearchaeota archaeon]
FDLNAGIGKLVIGSSTPSIALTTADATFSVGSITSDSDTTGAGVFMDGNGHFRVIGDADNQIIVDGGDMTIKSQDLTLLSTHFTASSDHGGYISLPTTASNAGYPGDDTWTTQNGVWLSGSGEFNLKQDGSRYIRHIKGQGIEMAFPNFSVDSDGNMTANSASFMGDIQAKSGFFGKSTGSGWIIDGATIRDDDSQIVIDGTSTSPSITIVSQSFSAEMVPDFTPGSVILAGGGNSYDSGVQGIDSSPEDTQTGTITNGNNFATANTVFQGFTAVTGGTSSPMTGSTAYGGMNGGDTDGEATAASLTGPDRVYKSSVSLEHKTTVSSDWINDSGINNWMTFGSVPYTLYLRLRKTNSPPSTVYEETISGAFFTDFFSEMFQPASGPWPSGGPYTHEMVRSFTRTVNHTVETDDDTYQWEISAANTTNNNLRGTYTDSNIGNKPGSESLTLTSCTTTITAASHAPSNKKVEIAPSGFQAVFLQEPTLEHADNSYFRVTPAEDKTVDILGSANITGSMKVKEIHHGGTVGYVNIDPNAANGIATNKDILGTNIQGARIEIGGTSDTFTHLTSGTGGILVRVSNANDFLFANGGDFHAGRDIIGYSADSNVSDIKFKENILPIHDALFKVKQLRGVEFDWKKSFNASGHDIGFVAQEVEKIDGLGVLVKDKKNFKTEEDMKTLSYTKVVPLLVEAIKEQQIQIEELQSKLEKLDGSIG